jgi:DNA repair protein RadD
MPYTLRPYQQIAVDRSIEFLRRPPKKSKTKVADNGIVVLPTGSGKSLVIQAVVSGLDAPCLIFQPSKEILEQNLAKFRSYGFNPAVYSASMGRKQVGDITLATIGSVKRAEYFQHAKYIIVDECHLVNPKAGMYRDFFDALEGIRILGMTASPYRLSADAYGESILKFLTRTRPKVFSEVVYYVQNGDLFRDGYLSKLKYYEIKGFDRAKLKTNSTGADYTDGSVQLHFREIGFEDKIVRVIERLLAIGRRGVLVFTRFVAESEYLVSQIPGAAIVTAETPKKERERILSEFRSGQIPVCCNVGCLTVGFDYPELDTVVLARPTMSLALHYQMIGRAVRPHPNKDHAMIIDMVGLVEQFGKVEDLTIRTGGKKGEKWYVASGNKPLSNVYFGDRPPVRGDDD